MKKIIAVIVVLMFAAVLFNINVFADTSSVDGGITSGGGGRGGSRTEYGNGLNVFFETLEDFTDGNITYDEFNSKTSTILEEYAGEFSDRAGITLINDIKSQVNDYVTKYGKNAPMYIYDSISDILNNYETTETIPTTDKKGYGACIKTNFVSSMTINTETYGDYIVLYSDSNGNPTYSIQANDGSQLMFVKRINGGNSQISYSSGGVTYSSVDYMDEGEYIHVYGDVRNSDGTPAETDDTYVDQLTYDFSNATDSELDELLQELKEELERQNPDLSTMEGLLESIYYRLGSLDSDNDNSLLGQVVSSINSLKESIENIDFEFDTDKEYNFEDIFGDFEFSIDFSDFFVDFEANINLYFTVEDGYFDTKFTELKDNFNSEFAFIDNISSYVKKIFDAFDALWEEDNTTEPEEWENDTAEYNS